jgi:hypothetical protein
MSDYADIIDGLHAVFDGVSGLDVVLDYAPTAVHDTPLLYSILDSVEITRGGQMTTRKFRILHRLLVPWQDNEQAEIQIMPFVDSIVDALDADPTLGGVITSGYAQITDIEALWVTIGGVEYRALDFYSLVIDKE